jgi:hypothetical protein
MVRCWQPSDGDEMESEPTLSEVIKRIAENMLSKRSRLPSSEAAHAALLFAHAGWNRVLGHPLDGYERALAAFETERPSLWRELKSRSAEDLIAFAEKEKMRLWSDDRRVILVCGILDGKVHVEWCYESDYESAQKHVEHAVRNPPPWVRKVGA